MENLDPESTRGGGILMHFNENYKFVEFVRNFMLSQPKNRFHTGGKIPGWLNASKAWFSSDHRRSSRREPVLLTSCSLGRQPNTKNTTATRGRQNMWIVALCSMSTKTELYPVEPLERTFHERIYNFCKQR